MRALGMAENTFMGVPREKIPWFPTIDYATCDFCMECDEFCPHRVFEHREGDEKLVVANPDNCVVFCRACAKTCGPDSITFPDKPEIVALIKKLRAEESPGPDGVPRAGEAPSAGAGRRADAALSAEEASRAQEAPPTEEGDE
jgi:NAD-dependent dihydropyrimidine dehydrogenase PreA subunit